MAKKETKRKIQNVHSQKTSMSEKIVTTKVEHCPKIKEVKGHNTQT